MSDLSRQATLSPSTMFFFYVKWNADEFHLEGKGQVIDPWICIYFCFESIFLYLWMYIYIPANPIYPCNAIRLKWIVTTNCTKNTTYSDVIHVDIQLIHGGRTCACVMRDVRWMPTNQMSLNAHCFFVWKIVSNRLVLKTDLINCQKIKTTKTCLQVSWHLLSKKGKRHWNIYGQGRHT